MAWIDGKRAKRIQTFLRDQGTYDGKIDGKLGEKSEKAIYELKGYKQNAEITSDTNPYLK